MSKSMWASHIMVVAGLVWFVVSILTAGHGWVWWFCGSIWAVAFLSWIYLGPIRKEW